MPEKIRIGPRVHHTRMRFCIVVVPLLLAGSEAAHALVERFAPPAYEGTELFHPGGPVRQLLPLLVPCLLALVLSALAMELLGGASDRRARRLPRVWAGVLPLLLFGVQEHLEYLLGHGRFPWLLALQWPFLAGLALQLPFALAAYLAARLLLRLAGTIAARRGASPRRRRRSIVFPGPAAVAPPPSFDFNLGRLTRGPPLRSGA
jgi:hypothetical protein